MSCDNYQAEFMRLSHHVHSLTQTYKMNCFISGLRYAVKYEVMAKNLTTMVEAMRLVWLEEEKNAALKNSSKSNAYKGFVSEAGGANLESGSTHKQLLVLLLIRFIHLRN